MERFRHHLLPQPIHLFLLEEYWFKSSQNLKSVHNHVVCKTQVLHDFITFDGERLSSPYVDFVKIQFILELH